MLSVRQVSAKGYRSLRALSCPVGQLEVLVGANGVGKTNLYRALELLQAAAENRLGQALAQEGLDAALWAGGTSRGQPRRVSLRVDLAHEGSRDADLRYEVEIGLPASASGAFPREPEIKLERVSLLRAGRALALVERQGASVMARDERGRPADADADLLASETVLGRLQDPGRYPELDAVRRTLTAWRFYHGFRTDPASALRHPCVAVASPTLASDGANLAAVFATLAHIRGDVAELNAAVSRAFPGSRLEIAEPTDRASFGITFEDFPERVFTAAELSDGTLQFLALAGALLGYRLPPFIALNEPEASLHPDLLEPLADLVVAAAERTQVWLVTHSERLADLVRRAPGAKVRAVIKRKGATWIEGLKLFGDYGDDED